MAVTGTALVTGRYRNFQDLRDLGVGDMRFAEMTALHGAVICNQPSIVKYLRPPRAPSPRSLQDRSIVSWIATSWP